MKSKPRGLNNWDIIHNLHALVELIKATNYLVLNQKVDKNHALEMYTDISMIFMILQQSHEELLVFRKRFFVSTYLLEHIGIVIGISLVTLANNILDKDYNSKMGNTNDNKANLTETKANNKLIYISLVELNDPELYGKVYWYLEN